MPSNQPGVISALLLKMTEQEDCPYFNLARMPAANASLNPLSHPCIDAPPPRCGLDVRFGPVGVWESSIKESKMREPIVGFCLAYFGQYAKEGREQVIGLASKYHQDFIYE